jgi:hypothetical protein
MSEDIWRNNKSGVEYIVAFNAIDTTNVRQGLNVVVYMNLKDDNSEIYVRETSEFEEKFTRV